MLKQNVQELQQKMSKPLERTSSSSSSSSSDNEERQKETNIKTSTTDTSSSSSSTSFFSANSQSSLPTTTPPPSGATISRVHFQPESRLPPPPSRTLPLLSLFGTNSPIRRLRLRGDWSGTGPHARPEGDHHATGWFCFQKIFL